VRATVLTLGSSFKFAPKTYAMTVHSSSRVVCGCCIFIMTCSTAAAQRNTVKVFGISSIGDEVALESEPSPIQGSKLYFLVYRDGGSSQEFPMVPLPFIYSERIA